MTAPRVPRWSISRACRWARIIVSDGGSEFLQQLQQVAHSARITPFVVIPVQHANEAATTDLGELRIVNRRMRIADDVGGDERLVAVLQNARQRTVGCTFDHGMDIRNADVPAQTR